MSIIKNTRKCTKNQLLKALQKGFLSIELLQGLLMLGLLLLLVSAYHVLSVHWQHMAIKRLEMLQMLSSGLASQGSVFHNDKQGMCTCAQHTKTITVPELACIIGEPVTVCYQNVTAAWYDERKQKHTLALETMHEGVA